MTHCLLLLFNSRQMKENPTPEELGEKTPGQEPGKIIIIWLWWA
jgi:hypothetical protein